MPTPDGGPGDTDRLDGTLLTARLGHRLTYLALRGVPVNLNLDTYEPHHPRYHELVAEDDSTAGVYTSIDGHKWMEKAEAYAISQRFDVVMESAMRDPRDFEEPARRFKAAGYQVEVAIVAVNRPRGRD